MLSITTVSDKIATVAGRWKEAFYSLDGNKWRMVSDTVSAETIYNELAALPADATREDVVKIMGTDHWIRLMCDECKLSVEAVMVYYASDEYNAVLCPGCVSKAMALIEKAIPEYA